MTSRKTAIVACSLLVWAAGCENYYKVTDPTTGKTYYTKNLDQQRSGSASLTDARTGNRVSIQNSEVAKVTKQEFDVGRYSTPPADAQAKTQTEENPFK